ncbi:MAG: hypothetical protein GX758_00465 [Tenericutes bacterium]|nr:hypothetical protein [Mycoplasmatota bacterium]
MSEKEVLSKFKKDFYSIFKSYYEPIANQKDKYNSMINSGVHSSELSELKLSIERSVRGYNIFYDIYKEVANVSAVGDILNVKNFILNNMKECKNINTKEREEFAKLQANKVDYETLLQKANEMKSSVERYNHFKGILLSFNKIIPASLEKNTNINMPLPQTNKEKIETKVMSQELPQEEKKKVSKNNDLDVYKNDKYVSAVGAVSHKICGLKKQLYSLSNEEEIRKVRIEIYDLCKKREEAVFILTGYEGVNILESIDSNEDYVYSQADFIPEKPYKLNSSEYKKEFDNLLYEIGDLQFNGEDSERYNESIKDKKHIQVNNFKNYYSSKIRKYNNLMLSLFEKNPSILSMSRDLINSLSLFNLEGGYSSFKSKHSDGMIGSEKISSAMYNEGIERINSLKDKLISYSTQTIDKKGGTIEITNHEPTKEENIKMLNKRYFEIYDLIIQKRENDMKL